MQAIFSADFLSKTRSKRKVVLSQEVSAQLRKELKHAYPKEGCGFLLGMTKGTERIVSEVFPVPNQSEGDQRTRFLIEPKEVLRVERYASDNQLSVLGVYHSHPDHRPVPSRLDHEAAWPEWSYLILSVHEGKVSELRSWVLNKQDQFAEESIKVSPPLTQ